MVQLNREGLDWVYWLANALPTGATLSSDAITSQVLNDMRAAWKAGEDPTEWRHYFATRCRKGFDSYYEGE